MRHLHGNDGRKTMLQAQGLAIRDVNKWFGANHVVKDLNVEVEPGEFLVLLGPSGCGKTTALRMIAGLEAADSGRIILGNNDITRVLPKYRDIAMVFQSYALYPHKTVAENIGFPLKVRKTPAADYDRLVREAAVQVRLGDLLDRYPRQLSGGQRQRVALARAIIRRPAVFLMDEPLSNLDAKLRGFMRAELKHMQHQLGVTTIYVTHDQVEAMTLAHRVAVMDNGVLQQIGTPRAVYDEPINMFVAGFLGSPPMNFLSGEIADGRFHGSGVSIPVAGEVPSGRTVLGFRPEDAEIVAPGTGLFDATVYAAELTGDVTLVTITVGEESLSIKMPKEFDADYDSRVAVRFALHKGFLFEPNGGNRVGMLLAAGTAAPRRETYLAAKTYQQQ
jgi:multiple sugar transport system ATP-binding protein